MLKCSSERWVCAPHSLSAGTSTTPRLSLSFRMSAMGLLLRCKLKLWKGGVNLLNAAGRVSASSTASAPGLAGLHRSYDLRPSQANRRVGLRGRRSATDGYSALDYRCAGGDDFAAGCPSPHARRLQVFWPATLVKRGNIILRTARLPKHDICLDPYLNNSHFGRGICHRRGHDWKS